MPPVRMLPPVVRVPAARPFQVGADLSPPGLSVLQPTPYIFRSGGDGVAGQPKRGGKGRDPHLPPLRILPLRHSSLSSPHKPPPAPLPGPLDPSPLVHELPRPFAAAAASGAQARVLKRVRFLASSPISPNPPAPPSSAPTCGGHPGHHVILPRAAPARARPRGRVPGAGAVAAPRLPPHPSPLSPPPPSDTDARSSAPACARPHRLPQHYLILLYGERLVAYGVVASLGRGGATQGRVPPSPRSPHPHPHPHRLDISRARAAPPPV
jgi:hypothetical protein